MFRRKDRKEVVTPVVASTDEQSLEPSRKQRFMAELKERTMHVALLFVAILIFVAVALLLLRDPISSADESREPDGVLNGHNYVDLGLSVMWADANIGAAADSLPGDRFAWGEIDAKEYYAEGNYAYIGHKVHSIERKRKHDAATNGYGRGWRMPSMEEVQELVEKCSWEPVVADGCRGYRVIGPNGNSIFIPADSAAIDTPPVVELWSAYAVEGDSTAAYALRVVDAERGVVATPAYRGIQVRAVTRM